MNIQFYLTEQEAIQIATKLQCRTDKIGLVIKATLLERRSSPNFRQLGLRGMERKKDFLDEVSIGARWIRLYNEEPRLVSYIENYGYIEVKYVDFKKSATKFLTEWEKLEGLEKYSMN